MPRLRTLALEALRASLLDSIASIEAAGAIGEQVLVSSATAVSEASTAVVSESHAAVRSSLEGTRKSRRARLQLAERGPAAATAATNFSPSNGLRPHFQAILSADSTAPVPASTSASNILKKSASANGLLPLTQRARAPDASADGERSCLSDTLIGSGDGLQAGPFIAALQRAPHPLRSCASARGSAFARDVVPVQAELKLARWSTGQSSLQQNIGSSETCAESATVHAGPRGFFVQSFALAPSADSDGVQLVGDDLSLGSLGRPVVPGNAAMYEAMMQSAGLDAGSKRCSINLSGHLHGVDTAACDEDAALHSRLLSLRQTSVRHAACLSHVSNSTLPVGDDRLCPVCITAEVHVEVVACKHAVCCECARMLCSLAGSTPTCPLCRATIGAFQPCGNGVSAQ